MQIFFSLFIGTFFWVVLTVQFSKSHKAQVPWLPIKQLAIFLCVHSHEKRYKCEAISLMSKTWITIYPNRYVHKFEFGHAWHSNGYSNIVR